MNKNALRRHFLVRVFGYCFPGLYLLGARLYRGARGRMAPQRRPASAQRPAAARDPARTAGALERFLCDWGIPAGAVLMVHSSWDQLKTFGLTPFQFIAMLQRMLGLTGTLCMPAFPWFPPGAANPVFSLRDTPSITGMVTELFRRQAGVRRSAQMRSVAALGPAAEHLVGDHHRSPYPSGPLSPYARFAECRARVLCLGVPAITNTMFHCGEDMLGEAFPARVYPPAPHIMQVEDDAGARLDVPHFVLRTRWAIRTNPAPMLKHLDASIVEHRALLGMDCSLARADLFLPRFLELARQGVHIYNF